jgi:antitoxin (DNA-binding transcriptional repressor) of toxin-antitoxin stability system
MLRGYNDTMSTITVQDIQRDPVAFLRRIEAGEVIVVVRGDQTLAEVRPMAIAHSAPRPFGLAAGEFSVPDDFDHPLPEDLLKDFEGA